MAIDPLLAAQIGYVLGWSNILGLILVLLSCRCIMNSRLNQTLVNSEFYKKFYNYHCYYWWFFIISVLLHAILAITGFGIPF